MKLRDANLSTKLLALASVMALIYAVTILTVALR